MKKKVTRLPSGAVEKAMARIRRDQRGGDDVTIDRFFTDPYYLGTRLQPEYFYPNQVRIAKAFYQQNLTDEDVEWLEELTSRGKCNWSPDEVYDTLILIGGQRWGKSYMISGLTLYEVKDWIESDDPWTDIPVSRKKPPIAKGAPVEIKQVATSKENAKDHVFAETQQHVEMSPYFQGRFDIDKKSKKMEIEFPNNLRLMAGASSGKSIRGGTNLAVAFDEICHQTTTQTYVGGEEIWKAMRNTTVTLGGRKFIISSPLTEDDQGMLLLRQALSGETRGTLAFWLSSFEVCPFLGTDPDILKIEAEDPEGFKRDFLAIPSSAKEPFFSQHDRLERIFVLSPPGGIEQPRRGASLRQEKKVINEMIEYVLSDKYPVIRRAQYVLAGDPSESNDAFGFCLGHLSVDKKHIDIDLVGRFTPQSNVTGEVDATEVNRIFLELVRKFKPRYVDDRVGYTEMRQNLRNSGAPVREVKMELSRAVDAKLGVYLKEGEYPMVRCYLYPQLLKELKGMELMNGKKIDYPRRSGEPGHGDVAIAFMHLVAELYDPKKRGPTHKEVQDPWTRRQPRPY